MKFINFNLGIRSERSRRRLIVSHLRLLQSVCGEYPIPVRYWLTLRSVARSIYRSTDTLLPPFDFLRSPGTSLQIEELRRMLRNDVLGTWALDRTTIELLWKRMQHEQPKIIIECGAGISTLMMAKCASLYYSELRDSFVIFSLEQDNEVKCTIEAKLKELGLSDQVQIFHTPISKQGKYELDTEKLLDHLGSEKADWLLIDGPAGPNGCRVWTLPLLSRFCRTGAKWFLDDAFRDTELRILREWSHLPGMSIKGIYPIGKGLATGVIKDPDQVAVV